MISTSQHSAHSPKAAESTCETHDSAPKPKADEIGENPHKHTLNTQKTSAPPPTTTRIPGRGSTRSPHRLGAVSLPFRSRVEASRRRTAHGPVNHNETVAHPRVPTHNQIKAPSLEFVRKRPPNGFAPSGKPSRFDSSSLWARTERCNARTQLSRRPGARPSHAHDASHARRPRAAPRGRRRRRERDDAPLAGQLRAARCH